MIRHLIPFLGWGIGSNSKNLYQVDLKLLSQSFCEILYDDPLDTFRFHPDLQICAGERVNGGKGVCGVSHYNAQINLKSNEEMKMKALSDLTALDLFKF